MDNVDLHTLWNAAIMRELGSLNILLVGEVDCVKGMPFRYIKFKSELTVAL
jgi:hypothetical protein